MPDLARLLLSPVLLWQGLHLYRTIPRLPEAAGARRGTTGSGPPFRLLVIGDSSAAGVGVETQEEALLGRTVARLAERRRVTYRLEARNGMKTARMLRRLRSQQPEPYEAALLGLGLNDVIAGRDLESWLDSYAELAEELRDRFEVKRLVVSGLPPVGAFPAIPNPLRWVLGRTARRFDEALRHWANTQPDVTFIDFLIAPGEPLHGIPIGTIMASDGFHPGPRIYDEWGRRAARALLSFQHETQQSR